MKHPMLATLLACGLAGGASVSAAQDEISMPNVNVTATQGQYETYLINLYPGYGLRALVGNTHGQYMQAQRAAENWEAQRRQGMAPRPYVSVAIDNSTGPGVARQIQLTDAARTTVAIVNVYCKHVARAGANRCQFVRQPTSTPTHRLASRLPAPPVDREG